MVKVDLFLCVSEDLRMHFANVHFYGQLKRAHTRIVCVCGGELRKTVEMPKDSILRK